jgi:hypothetical protein
MAALEEIDAALGARLASAIAASEVAARTLLLGNCGATRSVEGAPWTSTLTHANPLLTVFYAPGPPGSSYNRFKGVCSLPFPPSLVWDCLHDNARRHAWDRNIHRVASTPLAAGPAITPSSPPLRACIVHSQTRNVGIIAGRDFTDLPVFLSFADAPAAPAGPDAYAAPQGTLVSGGAGIEDAQFPPQPGFVRGWNSPGSGWVLEPVAQPSGAVHTKVHYLIHTDLKGWIPSALVNASLAVRAQRAAAFSLPGPFFLARGRRSSRLPQFLTPTSPRPACNAAKLRCVFYRLGEGVLAQGEPRLLST